MHGLILHSDRVRLDNLTISASGTDSDYNTGNLKDWDPNSLWKPSVYTGTQWLSFAVSVGTLAPSAWGIIGHDFVTRNVRARLYVGFADNGTTFDYLISTIDCRTAPDRWEPHTLATFGPIAKRYWRVYFDGANAQFQVARIFLGTAYQFGQTPDPPYRDQHLDRVVRTVTDGGHERRAKLGELYVESSLRWDSISETMVSDLDVIHDAQNGRAYPVVYVPHLTPDSNPYEARYCSLERLQHGERVADRYSSALTLKDVV